MLGYRRFLTSSASWFVGVGRGLSDGFGAPDLRVVAGLRVNYENEVKKDHCVPPNPVDPPEPQPVPPTPTPEALTLVVPNTYFAFDQIEIKTEYRWLLADFAFNVLDYMEKNPDMKFTVSVEGHTDSIGSKKYNGDLGLRRAASVAIILVEDGGISEDTIELLSDGEDSPIASNKTREGRAKNRRVIIKIGVPEAKYQENEPNKDTYDQFQN